jgi:dTDP-4-amino-4,6-dideoxygalactose transaminase
MRKLNFTRRLAIWPTLSPLVHFRGLSDWVPFPLGQENCRIYSRARHAIWQGCRTLKLEAGQGVLVPAYHHGSEIEALQQAGLRTCYYELNGELQPDPAELEALLEPGVRALYLIHYLGFAQDAAYWRQWCDERGLLLLEDAAQAFLATSGGRPVGSFGHMGVFCLYKTYGLPDGGALVTPLPPPTPTRAPQTGLWRLVKRHLNWVAARQRGFGTLNLHLTKLVGWWRTRETAPGLEFELGDPGTPPAALTSRLLYRIVDPETAERRRENYRFLLHHLGHMVPAPFASLPPGACPFAFPIEVDGARAFLQRLRRHGIVGLLFWINPHPSLPVADYPRSRALRERVLALPVHQELTRAALWQIVQAVRDTLAPQQPDIRQHEGQTRPLPLNAG